MYGLGLLSSLVLVRDDRQTVDFQHQDLTGTILSADAGIVEISVSPYIPAGTGLTNIAYLTDNREMVVYSLAHTANVLSYVFPAPTDDSEDGTPNVKGGAAR